MKKKSLGKALAGGVVALSTLFLSTGLQAQNQWKKLGVPYDAQTAISNGSAVFVSTIQDGIFRSHDGGNSWISVGFGASYQHLPVLANDGETLYVVTCTDTEEGDIRGPVYKSIDGGDNWTQTGTISNLYNYGCINHLAADGETLYASSETWPAELVYSADGGRNWSSLNLPTPEYSQVSALFMKNNELYIAGNEGIFKSNNGGASWIALNNGISNLFVEKLFFDDETAYALTSEAIYTSTDKGESWQVVNTPPSDHGIYTHPEAFTVNGSTLYLGTNNGVQKSTDGGNTWSACGSNPADGNPLESSLLFFSDGVVYAGGYEEVYFSTDDCTNWVRKPDLLKAAKSIAATDDAIYIGVYEDFSDLKGIAKSIDGGLSWTLLNLPFDGSPNILAAAKQTVFAVTENAVYKSADGGTTWAQVLDGISPTSFSLENNRVFVGTTEEIYRSLNGGDTWTRLSSNVDYMDAVAIADKGGVVYMSSRYQENLFKSINSGNNWTRLGIDIEFNGPRGPRPLTVSNNGTVYVGDQFNVHRSFNGGEDWETINPGSYEPGSGQFYDAHVLAAKGNLVYLSTDQGTFRLTEGVTGWRAIDEGLPSWTIINSFAFDNDSAYAYVENRGVFKRNLR